MINRLLEENKRQERERAWEEEMKAWVEEYRREVRNGNGTVEEEFFEDDDQEEEEDEDDDDSSGSQLGSAMKFLLRDSAVVRSEEAAFDCTMAAFEGLMKQVAERLEEVKDPFYVKVLRSLGDGVKSFVSTGQSAMDAHGNKQEAWTAASLAFISSIESHRDAKKFLGAIRTVMLAS